MRPLHAVGRRVGKWKQRGNERIPQVFLVNVQEPELFLNSSHESYIAFMKKRGEQYLTFNPGNLLGGTFVDYNSLKAAEPLLEKPM